MLALRMPLDIKSGPHTNPETVCVHRHLVLCAGLHAFSGIKARPVRATKQLAHHSNVCHVLALQVFTDIKARPQLNYRVRVSYLEIYNEACSDLLDISTQPSDIVIKEDTPDRVAVKGLSMPEVCTEAEALGKLFEVVTFNRLLTLAAAACTGGCRWWLLHEGV